LIDAYAIQICVCPEMISTSLSRIYDEEQTKAEKQRLSDNGYRLGNPVRAGNTVIFYLLN